MVDERRLRHDLIACNESLGLQLASVTAELITAGQHMNANATEIRELQNVLDAVGQHAQKLKRDKDSLEQERDLLLTENDSLANTKAFLLGEIKAVQASRTWSLIHRLRSMQRAL